MPSEQTKDLQQWITDEGYLVNPTVAVLRELADSLSVDAGRVNILVKPTVLRAIDREYTQSSRLTWLVEEDVIQFRELTGDYQPNLVVTDSVTGAFLSFQDFTVAVALDDETATDTVLPMVTELWGNAKETELRTPSYEAVEESFTDLLDAGVYDSFVTAVRAMEEAGRANAGDGGGAFSGNGHTHASILIAGAIHEISLRKLARCVERCSLSSRSSLSRIKQLMDEEGYLATTNIESDVGRPPMRLHVAGLNSGDDAALLAERAYEDLYRESSPSEQ